MKKRKGRVKERKSTIVRMRRRRIKSEELQGREINRIE